MAFGSLGQCEEGSGQRVTMASPSLFLRACLVQELDGCLRWLQRVPVVLPLLFSQAELHMKAESLPAQQPVESPTFSGPSNLGATADTETFNSKLAGAATTPLRGKARRPFASLLSQRYIGFPASSSFASCVPGARSYSSGGGKEVVQMDNL